MKKLTKIKFLALTLVLVMVCAVALTACNNQAKEALEAYELNLTGVVSQKALDTAGVISEDFILDTEIGSEDVGGPYKVTWSSNHAAIKIEDNIGKVTLQKSGITTVKLTAKLEKGGATRDFTVRVAQFDVEAIADNYTFTRNSANVYTNTSFALERETTYQDETATINWSVTDNFKEFLAISEDGNTCNVLDSAGGNARIRATFKWNNEEAIRNYNLYVLEKSAYILEPITEAKAGTFKLGMFQVSKNAWYYAIGEMGGYNNYYYGTTTDSSQAADYEIKEKSGEGWTIQVKSTGEYLQMIARDSATQDNPSASLYLVAEETDGIVWQWNNDAKAFYREVLGTNFYLGNNGSYTDIGSFKEDYVSNTDTNYLAKFGELVKDTTVQPEPEEGPTVDVGSATVVATFELGADGEAGAHDDGGTVKSGASYKTAWSDSADGQYKVEDGSYSLTFTKHVQMYPNALDNTGKGGMKLGTGSATGGFTIEIAQDIQFVKIYVAGYKANNTKILINGTYYYNITTQSNNGAYTAIVIDVRETHSVTLSTMDDANNISRCMIDKIELLK